MIYGCVCLFVFLLVLCWFVLSPVLLSGHRCPGPGDGLGEGDGWDEPDERGAWLESLDCFHTNTDTDTDCIST